MKKRLFYCEELDKIKIFAVIHKMPFVGYAQDASGALCDIYRWDYIGELYD